MRLHALSALALLTAVACASDSGAASGVQPSTTPATFTLAVGQRVVVPGTAVELTFVTVAADSRCPTGASCLWAGDAAVELTAGADRVTLHTGLADGREADAGGVHLALVDLVPQPTTDKAPAPGDYRVTITATKR